jgi:hypothetical protein
MAAYGRELASLPDRPLCVLELGVRRGGSLRLWRDVLPGSVVAGLDLMPVDVEDTSGRIHTFVGYQQDPEVLDRIAAEVAPEGFDLIVDDASHVGQYTVESFRHLFANHLRSGGVYVLEDWSCAYLPGWVDGSAYSLDSSFSHRSEPSGRVLDRPGIVERTHRSVRAMAPRVARHLGAVPGLKDPLRRLYMRAEGITIQRSFQSHQAGMVGVVKQIVDACAVDHIEGAASSMFAGSIRSVHVGPSLAFVHKV